MCKRLDECVYEKNIMYINPFHPDTNLFSELLKSYVNYEKIFKIYYKIP